MRISFVGAAERIFTGRLSSRLTPLAASLDAMLHGEDDRAVSQRIAIVAFVVRVISAAIAYVSQVLLARWMGEFEYGIFVVVWVGAVILGGLACLGFQTAVIRFVPEYVERGEARLLRGVLLGSRVHGFIAATVFAVIGGLGLYFFGDTLSSYYLIPLSLGALTLPMLARVHAGVARMMGRGEGRSRSQGEGSDGQGQQFFHDHLLLRGVEGAGLSFPDASHPRRRV